MRDRLASIRWVAGALALGLLALPAGHAFGAEGVRLSADHTPAGDPGIAVRSAEVRGHQLLRMEVLGVYLKEPLVTPTRTLELDRVVESQLFLHARAAYPLWHRVLLALDLPVLVAAQGAEEPVVASGAPRVTGGPALGDLAATARVRLLGEPGPGSKAAFEAKVWLPTGSGAAHAGDGSPSVLGAGIVSIVASRLHWSTEASVSYRSPREIGGLLPLRVGPALGLGTGAYLAMDAGRVLRAGFELSALTGVTGGARLLDPRSSQLDALVGVRLRPFRTPVEFGLFTGPGLGQRPGSPDYRVALSVGFLPERAPPPPDRDSDGVHDGLDACPELPGSRSGDAAMNGCPEVPRDRDGDAIPDTFDACPGEPGEPTAERRTHGCPRREPPRSAVVEARIEISEQVRFATGTADLEPRSERVLAELVSVLAAHPDIRRVEVRGYTDDTGDVAFNRRLSLERAESVVSWLVLHGVAAERLFARGFGTAGPSGSAPGHDLRATQRRVEFVILERAGGKP